MIKLPIPIVLHNRNIFASCSPFNVFYRFLGTVENTIRTKNATFQDAKLYNTLTLVMCDFG